MNWANAMCCSTILFRPRRQIALGLAKSGTLKRDVLIVGRVPVRGGAGGNRQEAGRSRGSRTIRWP